MKINPNKSRNRMRALLLLTVLFAALTLTASAQETRLLPFDEASRDASFVKFRHDLIRAARRRDVRHLLSVVDPQIKIGFGGEDGIGNFKKQWKLTTPGGGGSALWNELLSVLTRGGAFQKDAPSRTFWAPYIYSNFPENLDAFEFSAVTEKNVGLLARPLPAARRVATLSYHLVKVDFANSVKSRAGTNDYAWLKVETIGGKKGFVPGKFVRSPIDYRAAFEKRRGRWMMTLFLAGD